MNIRNLIEKIKRSNDIKMGIFEWTFPLIPYVIATSITYYLIRKFNIHDNGLQAYLEVTSALLLYFLLKDIFKSLYEDYFICRHLSVKTQIKELENDMYEWKSICTDCNERVYSQAADDYVMQQLRQKKLDKMMEKINSQIKP